MNQISLPLGFTDQLKEQTKTKAIKRKFSLNVLLLSNENEFLRAPLF